MCLEHWHAACKTCTAFTLYLGASNFLNLQQMRHDFSTRYSSQEAEGHIISINHTVSNQLELKQMSREYEDQT